MQAEQQLGPGWSLMRDGTPGCPSIHAWLGQVLPQGGRVGIDPFVHTMDAAKKLAASLAETGQVLVPLLGGNLVDNVWGSARPAPPEVTCSPLKPFPTHINLHCCMAKVPSTYAWPCIGTQLSERSQTACKYVLQWVAAAIRHPCECTRSSGRGRACRRNWTPSGQSWQVSLLSSPVTLNGTHHMRHIKL